jgi:hypothetical protein
MRSDTQIIRVPIDGGDLNLAVRNAAKLQASRDPDPRRLVAATVLANGGNLELLLVFELFNQN